MPELRLPEVGARWLCRHLRRSQCGGPQPAGPGLARPFHWNFIKHKGIGWDPCGGTGAVWLVRASFHDVVRMEHEDLVHQKQPWQLGPARRPRPGCDHFHQFADLVRSSDSIFEGG